MPAIAAVVSRSEARVLNFKFNGTDAARGILMVSIYSIDSQSGIMLQVLLECISIKPPEIESNIVLVSLFIHFQE